MTPLFCAEQNCSCTMRASMSENGSESITSGSIISTGFCSLVSLRNRVILRGGFGEMYPDPESVHYHRAGNMDQRVYLE